MIPRGEVTPPDASNSTEANSGPHAGQPCPRLPIEDFAGRWWVLHTRPRSEKALAISLQKLDIQHFLPLIHYKRTYSGRIRHVDIPLFPGYVFLCGSEDDRLAALKTNRIANVLEVVDQAGLREDLRHVSRAVQGSEPIDLYPGLRKGSRCRVTRGSLAGLEGVVIRRRGPWKVYVGVDFVGQSAELEIDSTLLEVLD